jgi:hypothetical protein
VAGAGDVNGDGFPDIVVGAPGVTQQTPVFHVGEVYVYLGSASGPATSPSTTLFHSGFVKSGFGNSVAGAGDVNGDGYDDIIVGDPGYQGFGSVTIYFGSPSGTSTTEGWRVISTQDTSYGASFGTFVAGAGDVNADGYADVLVADPFHNSNQLIGNGAVYLYLGGPGGPATTPDWTVIGAQEGSTMGYPAAFAGDVNGDGYDEIIVSELRYIVNNAISATGRVLVYLGSPTGPAVTPNWIVEASKCCNFGSSVASAGDVNADGYDDIIIGQSGFSNSPVGRSKQLGRAQVYLGSASGLPDRASWTVQGPQDQASFGDQVSSAGDLNGDGFDDVIVSAPHLTDGQFQEGRVIAYLGSSAGLSTTVASFVDGNQDYLFFGFRIGPAGDVNGDGRADIIVGTEGPGGVFHGHAWIYPGTN